MTTASRRSRPTGGTGSVRCGTAPPRLSWSIASRHADRHCPERPDAVGRSTTAAGEAIDRCAAAGILTQITVGRRNRAWEAAEVVDAFTDLERSLASPTGDTGSAEPARAVPARRRRD